MTLIIIGIILFGLLFIVVNSRSQLQKRNQQEEEKLLKQDLDGFMERKQAYNQMQKPGEVDNSVEVIRHKTRK